MLPCEVRSSRTSSEVGANFERSGSELRAKWERTLSEVEQTLSEVEQTSSEVERTSSEVELEPALLGAKCVAYRCIFRFASGEESVDFVRELRMANYSEYKRQRILFLCFVMDARHLQSPESYHRKVYQPEGKVFRSF